MATQLGMKASTNLSAMMAIPPPEHLWFLAAHRLSLARVAHITGRTLRTVTGWRRRGITDPACLALLQVHAYGLLPGPAWQEWHIEHDGRLTRWMASARHPSYNPGMLDGITITFQQLADIRRRLATLEAEQAAMTDPGSAGGDPPQLGLFLRP